MGIYQLHVCKGDRIVADAGRVDVAEPSAAVAAGVLVAKELAADQRFLLAAVIVTDWSSKVLVKVPIWSMARSRRGEDEAALAGST